MGSVNFKSVYRILVTIALSLCVFGCINIAYAAEGDAGYQDLPTSSEGKTIIRITYDPDSIEWNGKTMDEMTQVLSDATKVEIAGEKRVDQYSLKIENTMWSTPQEYDVFREDPIILDFSPNPDYELNSSKFNAEDYVITVNGISDATVEQEYLDGNRYVRVRYYPQIPDSQKYILGKDEYNFTLNGENQYLTLGNNWEATEAVASDPSVLEFGKIDLDKKQIPVITKNSGTAVVTVSDEDGNSTSCIVTIEDDRMPLEEEWEWDEYAEKEISRGLVYYPGKHYTYTMDVGTAIKISDTYGYDCYDYTSTDPNVAKAILGDEDAEEIEDYYTRLYALSPGTSLITLYDKGGLTTVLLTVRDKTHSINAKYKDVPYAFDIQTGCNYTLTMYTWDENEITVKDYKGAVRQVSSVNSSNTNVLKVSKYDEFDEEFGGFYISCKNTTGTSTVTIVDDKGSTSTIKVTVKEGKPSVLIDGRIYSNSRKVTVESWCLKKGDIIKLKVGKKTYKKKITKATGFKTVKFKISKPGFYGKTIKASVVRKGKTRDYHNKYVYFGKSIRKGYTKKQVRWLSNWGKPYSKSKTSKTEIWYYKGSKDRYVYFRKGRVIDWAIYN